MKNKKKTFILIALFILLMAGASVLYNNLSADFKMDSLMTTENSDTNESDTAANKTNSNNTNTTETSTQNTDSSNNAGQQKQLTTAPNFTVYDIESSPVNLTDFFGKPIIVNFWASWCGPCKMEMPDFDEAYKIYKDEITFLMVNMTDGSRETVESASDFIAESGYTFPVYYDTEYNASITYSVSSLPTTYFINADGELIAHARGAIDADTLQTGISMIYTE